jgi:hypothetical protein
MPFDDHLLGTQWPTRHLMVDATYTCSFPDQMLHPEHTSRQRLRQNAVLACGMQYWRSDCCRSGSQYRVLQWCYTVSSLFIL